MRLIGLVVACAVNLVFAQVQAPDGSFNVTNPIQGGTFVQGKTLPIVYDLLDNPIALELNVYLVPSGSSNGNSSEVTIKQNADISEDASSMHTQNNKTYWEHTINYPIPSTLAAGAYNVVFQDVLSHTNTTVPILINAVPASSSAASISSTSASSVSSTAGASSSVVAASTPPQSSAANQVVFTWLYTTAYLFMAAALVL
ncbi:hypothetical protein NQZ79_g3521 [Umbelopsis isabellina]|nr:hypothetical protein NQZ79_g3521 [Umbelopsis isabellina]